jgi:hypothetical protein
MTYPTMRNISDEKCRAELLRIGRVLGSGSLKLEAGRLRATLGAGA